MLDKINYENFFVVEEDENVYRVNLTKTGTDLRIDDKKYEKYEVMRRSFITNDTYLVKA